MSWDRKIGKIGRRSLAVAYGSWARRFEALDPWSVTDCLTESVQNASIPELKATDSSYICDAIESRTAMREIFDLRLKSTNLLRSAIIQYNEGLQSSSYVSAYHSMLFNMRAFCGMLGVFFVKENGRHLLIDFLPWTSGADSGKKFKRTHGGSESNKEVFGYGNSNPTQGDYYDLFIRLIKPQMYIGEIVPIAATKAISRMKRKSSNFDRNLMIYNSEFPYIENRQYLYSDLSFWFIVDRQVKEFLSDADSGDISTFSSAVLIDWFVSTECRNFPLYNEFVLLSEITNFADQLSLLQPYGNSKQSLDKLIEDTLAY